MKKTLSILLAAATLLAACTKSEIAYEQPQEIGFNVVAGNITKASGLSGALSNTQELGIWAFWANTTLAETPVIGTEQDDPGYTVYNDNYLVNALFANKGASWGGSPDGYPWPINGSLVFAGYTTPGDVVLATNTAVSYDLATDVMTFTDYENTNEFDLCWFGRTENSYNYYNDASKTVPANLSHTLAWISVKAYGEGLPAGNWKITSMTLNNVVTKGTATCTGSTKKATWTSAATANKEIYSGDHTLSDSAPTTALTNNLVIPSLPLELTVNYSFPVNGVDKTDSKTISLKLNDANTQLWESGVHYTYTLLFKANEILVAPSYNAWGSVDKTITVE